MSIERIDRALEVARLQRSRATEQLVAAASPPQSLSEIDPIEHAPVAAAMRLRDAPIVEWSARELLRERYVVFPDENGPASQAYKMLRTQVLQRARQNSMRCIGIVSAASGEGKSVTAINLALSIAADPTQSVLLVDLDLRNPSVARRLGIESGEGIEAVLTSHASVASVLRRASFNDRLGIVPACAPVAESSELLATPRAAEVMRELRSVAGEPLVLIDLPPALLSDDVLALAPLLDGVVLVVTEERTRREDIQRVFDLLRDTPVIGTVLNASADAETRAY
jgi:Mrp family chromosome partitioning ATPase